MTAATIDDIQADFEFLDDWEDRYRYVIELGRALPDFAESQKTPANKVKGCVSQVWITTELSRSGNAMPVVSFCGDSDALIVRGLIAILIAMLSGKPANEIVELDAQARLAALGLHEHLSPQRSNGLAAMIGRIKADAGAAAAAA